MEQKPSVFKRITRYLSWTLLLIVAGILYVLVFNENSYSHKLELNEQITRLEDEIKAVRDTAEYYRALNSRIVTDRATMERVVREEFHMVRDNEDLYIFE